MICYLFPKPLYFIFSSEVPALLYYSYIPTTIAALLIGFYVLRHNRYLLLNQLLFLISVLFSFWTISALIEWTSIYSEFILFIWSFQGIFPGLIAIFSIYFIYVFLNKKDISRGIKIVFLVLLAPIFITAPSLYLKGFNITNCDAFEFVWYPFQVYYILLGVLAMVWILVLLIKKYFISEDVFKKQIFLMGIGIESFLFLFFLWINSIDYLTGIGILVDSRLEMYGMLGMVIFIGLLAYSIVRFKAFEIKLLGAQALVVAIVILIGSQFFFIKTTTNMILNGVTFVLVSIFGYWLVKSVKEENKRKEELQDMANQLAEGNDKLQKLDNAKSEFLSIASHQLRTPPTAIKGYSSLLLEGSYGKLTDEQSAALNNVYKRNEDMINLIDNLLETSRIESETIRYETKTFKLEDLLKDIYETLIFKAKEKKLLLEFVPNKDPLPEITTDKDRLREVISNLVDNAVKYTKEGKVILKTELQKGFTALTHESANPVPIPGAEKENQEIDVIRITVSDTGIGIPATELPFLFQKFSRGKDISRLNVSGTGLGLFVGKEIMEALGGKVWAESEGEGKGSTFVAEIPVKREDAEISAQG